MCMTFQFLNVGLLWSLEPSLSSSKLSIIFYRSKTQIREKLKSHAFTFKGLRFLFKVRCFIWLIAVLLCCKMFTYFVLYFYCCCSHPWGNLKIMDLWVNYQFFLNFIPKSTLFSSSNSSHDVGDDRDDTSWVFLYAVEYSLSEL